MRSCPSFAKSLATCRRRWVAGGGRGSERGAVMSCVTVAGRGEGMARDADSSLPHGYNA